MLVAMTSGMRLASFVASFVVVSVVLPGGNVRAEDPAPRETRSPWTAFALSAGSTALGLGLLGIEHERAPGQHAPADQMLVLGGGALVMVGPSLGHFYVDDTRSVGLYVRGVGAGVAMIAALASIPKCEGQADTGIFADCRNDVWIGLGIIGFGAVIDVVSAPHAASQWNRDHAVTIAPIVAPAPGLAIAGTF